MCCRPATRTLAVPLGVVMQVFMQSVSGVWVLCVVLSSGLAMMCDQWLLQQAAAALAAVPACVIDFMLLHC